MVVLEKRPELAVGVGEEAESELCVERTDISFVDLPGNKVRVEVTVHNAGEHRSAPTAVRLESAPLGAFVRWRPLARLAVPALEPGESRELSVDIRRPRPVPLGDFNRVPPRLLVTSVSPPDQPAQPDARLTALVNLFRRTQTRRPAPLDLAGGRSLDGSLAPDLRDLLGKRQPHWAGNINVFVGARPVERHMARALRIYPGRTNLAMFMVGNPGQRDAFAFEVEALMPGWTAALYDTTGHGNLLPSPSDRPIQETRWVESNGGLLVILATQPPADCRVGNVEVHVTRRTSNEKAVVEFNLDPCAQGPGCYFV